MQRAVYLTTAQNEPPMSIPLLMKPVTYQSGVACLFRLPLHFMHSTSLQTNKYAILEKSQVLKEPILESQEEVGPERGLGVSKVIGSWGGMEKRDFQ